MAEPDRILLVVRMASMGRLVERQAGSSLARREFGQAGGGECVGVGVVFMLLPSVVSVAQRWEETGSTGRTPAISAEASSDIGMPQAP
ncbi:MAG: hypothetical protein IPP85_16350 [Propionivibrio sp.]|nr:hypothetical protein [Propionivibrio sp.]